MLKKLHFISLALAYILLFSATAMEKSNDASQISKNWVVTDDQKRAAAIENCHKDVSTWKLSAQYSSPKKYKPALTALAKFYKHENNEEMCLTCFWRAEDFEKCQAAANEGNPYAQNALGYMYENGQGIAIDPFKAADYWGLAAKQDLNDPKNQLELALERYEVALKGSEEGMKYNIPQNPDRKEQRERIINYIKEKL